MYKCADKYKFVHGANCKSVEKIEIKLKNVFVVFRPFASTATANFNLDICLSQFGAYEFFFYHQAIVLRGHRLTEHKVLWIFQAEPGMF